MGIGAGELIVTTVRGPSETERELAQLVASRMGSRLCSRGKISIPTLIQRRAAAAAVVVGEHAVRLEYRGRSYSFHPNMALHRIAALRAGRGDRLVSAAGLQPGDRVLDCTCGMGTDAVVLSYAAGETGAVSALEASPPLAAIVEHGMQNYRHKDGELVAAMQRVSIRQGDYAGLLATLPDGACEVIYFDPMFESTFADAQGIDLVRFLGCYGRPGRAELEEARRVAGRCVVVKDPAPGEFLKEMGVPVVSDTKRVWYGRLPAR
jgi:hypothetical protein